MSVKVISAVMSYSEARLAARLVLLAIADNAEDGSGIGFPPIVDHPDTPENRRRSIAFKTRLSEREVRDSLRELEAMGELLTTQAQRGRARINVYRVTVGYLRDRDPQVEDLPFKLLRPFPATTGGIRRQSEDGTGGEISLLSGQGLAAEDRVDHRQRTASTTGTPLITRAGDKTGPSVEPAAEPSDLSPRTESRDGQPIDQETAAASESGPASIERAVSSLAKLTGWDTGSLAVVMPLVQQLPAELFEDTLSKTFARRGSNPPGLLVHLLRVAIGDWRQAQNEARLATWDEFFGEAGLERVKREDPDRYVTAWATPSLDAARPLPGALVVDHVLEYLEGFPVAERLRLAKVFEVAAGKRPAARLARDYVLTAIDRRSVPLADVEAALGAMIAAGPELDELLAFAREIHANVEQERAA